MSAKQIRQFEVYKGLEKAATAADIRHEISKKVRKAQKLLTEVMELEAKLRETEG